MHPESGPLKYHDVKGLHCVSESWWLDTGLKGLSFTLPPQPTMALACRMNMLGRLFAEPGYLWDGSSGPTVDSKADPVPSLAHDLLYEAIRASVLYRSAKPEADALYRDLLIERGMSRTRAYARWVGLRLFGWTALRRGPQYPARVAS